MNILRMMLLVIVGMTHAAWADDRQSLIVQGVERNYLVHLPPSSAAKPALLLVFHGALATGEGFARTTNNEQLDNEIPLNGLADRYHMAVIYPDGIDRHWNDGRPGTARYGEDVVFVSQLIDEAVSRYGVDPKRVYATGFSNGAMFTYRLACELSEKIAAIAPVSGLMPDTEVASCHPAQPVAFLLMQGTADTFSLPAGGESNKGAGGKVLSDQDTFSFWARLNACQGPVQSQVLAGYHVLEKFRPRDLQDAPVHVYQYQACGTGKPVRFIELADGGHMWPGSLANFGVRMGTGKISDFPANKALMEFFALQSK